MPEEKPPEGSKPGETPAAPAAPPAATPAAKPAAEAKVEAKAHEKPAAAAPTGPIGQPWSGDIVDALHKTFPDITVQGFTYLNQNYLILPRESIVPVAMFLKTELHFTLLVDLTAADYPKRDKRFEVIYQLYSFSRNEQLRLKAPVGEQETIETVTPVWSGADWMEREAYDMFGIRFEHHPNMKRILLPDEWEGFPLRKDYGILQQDERWVRENLHIDSAQ